MLFARSSERRGDKSETPAKPKTPPPGHGPRPQQELRLIVEEHALDEADRALYQPVPGDYGARGEFDSVARSSSVAWWLSKHRAALLTGAAALLAGGALVRMSRD